MAALQQPTKGGSVFSLIAGLFILCVGLALLMFTTMQRHVNYTLLTGSAMLAFVGVVMTVMAVVSYTKINARRKQIEEHKTRAEIKTANERRTATMLSMASRTEDIIAMLRDFVDGVDLALQSEAQTQSEAETRSNSLPDVTADDVVLATMLKRGRLFDFSSDAPPANYFENSTGVYRTTAGASASQSNDTSFNTPLAFYLENSTGSFRIYPENDDPQMNNILMGLEAALTLYVRAGRIECNPLPTQEQVLAMHQKALRAFVDAGPIDWPDKVFWDAAYEDCSDDLRGAEWAIRNAFASYMEKAVLPFHVDYFIAANMDTGRVCLELQVPHPDAFHILDVDDQGGTSSCAAQANAYMVRVALRCAQECFDKVPAVKDVCVSCVYATDKNQVRFSAEMDREQQAQLKALLPDEGTDVSAVFAAENVRAKLDNLGKLLPVQPFVEFDDSALDPPERYRETGCIEDELSGDLFDLTGAKRVCDLAWSERTIADCAAYDADCLIRRVELDSMLERMNKEGFPGDMPDEVDKTLLLELETVLSNLEESGDFQDDENVVWRHFRDITERIRYNIERPDGERTCRLMPASLFKAHEKACMGNYLLNMDDKAAAHMEWMIKAAPFSLIPPLLQAYQLQREGRFSAVISVWEETLDRVKWSIEDLSTCFERLAFAEWNVGNDELCAACLLRALRYPTTSGQRARKEYLDLIERGEISSAKEMDFDEEAILEEAGLLSWLQDEDLSPVDRFQKAGILLTDAGYFIAAADVASVCYYFDRDFILLDMARILNRTKRASGEADSDNE